MGPEVPRPATRRGRDLAQQRLDASRGRWNERILPMVFGRLTGVAPQQTVQTPIQSLGSRYVRMLGFRGVLVADNSSLLGVELASLRLQLLVNGQENLISSENANTASFAALFSDDSAPWYWFAAPPRMRTGDVLTATIIMVLALGEGTPQLTPELDFMMMDDEIFRELYDRQEAAADA